MIIVMEGPDGAGKSTMVEAVKQIHLDRGHAPESVQTWRAGPFPEGGNSWDEYVVPLSSLSISSDWLVIIDRWHLGELVYGPLLRGQSRLSLEQRDWIDGYLKSLGAIMVYLKATPEELTRRLGERGDDLIKAEQLPYLLEAYDALINIRRVPLILTCKYDTTGQRTPPMASAVYLAAEMEVQIATFAYRTETPYRERYSWPS